MEALYYEEISEKTVKCLLCPHNCIISNGNYGICRVRKNINGKLFAENYEKIAAFNVDPIEKKPLYHFYPGKNILSIGANGCNLKCNFCQNWQLSQKHINSQTMNSSKILDYAISLENNIGIAYTYSESIVWYEFILELSKKVSKQKLNNVLITNGYIEEEPLYELLPYLNAVNIDLKAFSNDFYKKMCKATLAPVLRTIKIIAKKCHLELTNLLIPGENDNLKEITEMVSWIADISPDIPIHFSKYHPNYNCNNPQTTDELLNDAYTIASQKLNFVFIGNVFSPEKSCTYCPKCNNILIERDGFFSSKSITKNGICSKCGYKLNVLGVS